MLRQCRAYESQRRNRSVRLRPAVAEELPYVANLADHVEVHIGHDDVILRPLRRLRDELAALEKTWLAHPVAGHDIAELRARLKAVNERLWVIEDDVRLKEKAQAFDDDFVRLARSVYIENDERARIKKAINLALGSSYVEEKSYQDYRVGGTP